MADDERRAGQGKNVTCARNAGVCDQRVPCAFHCWWKPTMAALNHEANQYGR